MAAIHPYRQARIAVPGKRFRMGSSRSGEGPVREVTVAGFALAKCMTSAGQFKAHCTAQQTLPYGRLLFSAEGHVVGALRGATKEQTGAAVLQFAVNDVRWSMASDWMQLVPMPEQYVARFSKIPRADSRFLADELPASMMFWEEAACYALCAGGRLPTEAEYELAARSDASGNVREGEDVAGTVDGTVTVETAHCGQNWDAGGLLSVDTGKPAHPLGFMHLAGNLWMYCADHWSEALDSTDVDQPLHFAASDLRHVLRGGAWSSYPEYARASARNYCGDDYNSNVGVRVAWPQDSQS
ncbi:MAG: SUMF1/EgtB/PvdO family nonheme iron enzyme [Deltaproteobacteria bacterium]|nr:SUMF1/EgtB/PvdO family nonheme iron enzyme [Deltaproteobacteria bacterium]